MRQRGKNFYCHALLSPPPPDGNVALSGQHERGTGSEREPGTVFISSTCMSHGRFRCQRGSARVVESLRLAEQAASHSASRRASCQAGYQFLVAICVGVRPCRGPPLPAALHFLQPLFLFRESCLTAAHRRWNEKPVTAASFPPFHCHCSAQTRRRSERSQLHMLEQSFSSGGAAAAGLR